MTTRNFSQRAALSGVGLLMILVLLLSATAKAQPNSLWTEQFGTTDFDYGAGIVADGAGHVYVAGTTGGELALPNGFLHKYDDSGALIWDRDVGTSDMDDEYSAVALDGIGNLYVSGTTSPQGTGDDAAVLHKYDSAGNTIWTRQLGSFVSAGSVWVSTDVLGNAYVVGSTSANIGGAPLGELDAFVAKYDGLGNLEWSRQFGTSSHDAALGVSTDAFGNVYIVGDTEGGLAAPFMGGERDGFLVKYDGTGNQLWAQQIGTIDTDVVDGVSTDGLGNVYVAGDTEGGLEGLNLGSSDAFVRKFDEAGNTIWTRQFGTSDFENTFAVSTDEAGNVFVSGSTAGSLATANAGDNDAFISKFDEAGNSLWVHQFGTIASDLASSVSPDGLGNLYATGLTEGNFGAVNLGFADAYVAKFAEVPEPNTFLLSLLAGVSMYWGGKRRKPVMERQCNRATLNTWRARRNLFGCSLFFALALCLACDFAEAKKPDNTGGGKPGGSSELELLDLHSGEGVSRAYAINDASIIAGTVDDVAGTWDASFATPVFTALPGGGTSAYAINDAGEIVGDSEGPAYWASSTADPVPLMLPPQFITGWALGISADGVIVGELFDGSQTAAAAWRVTNEAVFGPVLLGIGGANDVATTAPGINRIVGRAADGTYGHVATAWDIELHANGSFTVTDSTQLVIGETSEAYAITDTGDVAGIIRDIEETIEDQAFAIRAGSLSLLSSGGKNMWGVGMDLNDSDIVGSIRTTTFADDQAARWNLRNKPVDLMREYFDASWSSASAQGINGSGEIVGYGSGGAWLLRHPLPSSAGAMVIPEPSTLVLAFLGLVGAVGFRRGSRH